MLSLLVMSAPKKSANNAKPTISNANIGLSTGMSVFVSNWSRV